MAKRDKLTDEAIRAFLSGHPGWGLDAAQLVKTYAFKHYGAAVGFVVHVGFAAEKQDHHPDLHVSWGKVRVSWSTHDAGGVTAVDVEMAELTDHIFDG